MARLGRWICHREQREGVALAAVGDEHLAAVHDVVLAVAARARADGLNVRTRVRLGEAETAAEVAARETRQEAAALLVGAVRGDDQGHHRMAVDHARQRHPAPAQLLDHAGVDADGQAEPPVLPRYETAEEPELPHALDQPVRVAIGMVQLARHRLHLVLDEASHGADEGMPGRIGHAADSTLAP